MYRFWCYENNLYSMKHSNIFRAGAIIKPNAEEIKDHEKENQYLT